MHERRGQHRQSAVGPRGTQRGWEEGWGIGWGHAGHCMREQQDAAARREDARQACCSAALWWMRERMVSDVCAGVGEGGADLLAACAGGVDSDIAAEQRRVTAQAKWRGNRFLADKDKAVSAD